MTSLKTRLSLNPGALGQAGEQFWRNWQGTMLDARETLLKSMESRSPVDFWTAQAQFGVRNAQRWAGLAAAGPECLAPEPADTAPAAARKPAAVIIDVEPEEAAAPAAAAAPAPASEPHAAPAEEQPVDAPEVPEAKGAVEAEAAAPVMAPAAVEPEPAGAEAAQPATDDLQRIRGIGPAIATKLNDQGIFTYAQIAAMDDAAVAALDETLNFRGRIDRDDWVGQARQLAAS